MGEERIHPWRETSQALGQAGPPQEPPGPVPGQTEGVGEAELGGGRGGRGEDGGGRQGEGGTGLNHPGRLTGGRQNLW